MNKKFSTLMAGLMLASAFSVASATEGDQVKKYETNKTYYLGVTSSLNNSGKVIAVVSNPSLSNYGQLILVDKDELDNISAVKAASWSIVFTQPTDGTAPKFTYINKATGLTLALDKAENGELAFIKGSSSSWLNSSTTDNGNSVIAFDEFRSYYAANKYVTLVAASSEATEDGVNFFGTQKDDAIDYTELTVFTIASISANSLGTPSA